MENKQARPAPAVPAQGLDVAAIRAAAARMEDGAVTPGYAADRAAVLQMLNDALATELVCMLRYRRHYYTISGLGTSEIKAEFLEHAQEELAHADRIAERIVQLGGEPDFNPAILPQRSHAEYDAAREPQAMVRANLVAERVAIESYRQMIAAIGERDPSTRQLLVDVLIEEEQHAEDMRDLLRLHA